MIPVKVVFVMDGPKTQWQLVRQSSSFKFLALYLCEKVHGLLKSVIGGRWRDRRTHVMVVSPLHYFLPCRSCQSPFVWCVALQWKVVIESDVVDEMLFAGEGMLEAAKRNPEMVTMESPSHNQVRFREGKPGSLMMRSEQLWVDRFSKHLGRNVMSDFSSLTATALMLLTLLPKWMMGSHQQWRLQPNQTKGRRLSRSRYSRSSTSSSSSKFGSLPEEQKVARKALHDSARVIWGCLGRNSKMKSMISRGRYRRYAGVEYVDLFEPLCEIIMVSITSKRDKRMKIKRRNI